MSSAWLIPGIDARLRELHSIGSLSFRDIASRLNVEFGTRLTRHSCIGRADRLKLEKRSSPIRPKARFIEKIMGISTETPIITNDHHALPAIEPPAAAAVVPKLPKYRLTASGKTFAELDLDDCRWPFGELTEKPVLFCGRLVRQGTSWCAKHHVMVYSKGRDV